MLVVWVTQRDTRDMSRSFLFLPHFGLYIEVDQYIKEPETSPSRGIQIDTSQCEHLITNGTEKVNVLCSENKWKL